MKYPLYLVHPRVTVTAQSKFIRNRKKEMRLQFTIEVTVYVYVHNLFLLMALVTRKLLKGR